MVPLHWSVILRWATQGPRALLFLLFRILTFFCKNMKYHFLVFHLHLVLRWKDDTICMYCTCRIWHNVPLLAFDKRYAEYLKPLANLKISVILQEMVIFHFVPGSLSMSMHELCIILLRLSGWVCTEGLYNCFGYSIQTAVIANVLIYTRIRQRLRQICRPAALLYMSA